MKPFRIAAASCVATLLVSVAFAQSLPEAVTTEREMVVTANPLATEAGERILRRGGTAVDAMIAVQTVLGLVEPQSSGIGGGAFVVYYDAATGELTTFDAREKAPMAATEDRFLDEEGNSRGFFANWQSGLSVGVPGIPALMEELHDRYGRLQYRTLFNPAKALAQGGFEITGRTSSQVDALLSLNSDCENRLFFRDPVAFEYFTSGDTTDCAAKPEGTRIKNKDYADLMKILSRQGADGFYSGPVAEAIIAAVQGDLNIPGDMTLADLAAYEVIERAPVCQSYRGYEVCGMGPPSSGGLAVGQMLGMLETFPLLGTDPLDPLAVHRFVQANALAFADRNLFVGDTDFVTVPVEGMLNDAYLASRAALIEGVDRSPYMPGTPPGDFDPTAPQVASTDSGTSHISIVDRYGNALSMTTTIESSFGNGVIVDGYGFLLNNQLTDFSFQPTASDGTPIANRVQPGKRPRSSMSPTIVLDDAGNAFLVTGSPGGSRIIAYTAQSIVNVIDFGLDPQEAINVPHYMDRNGGGGGSTDIEAPIPGVTLDYDAAALKATLEDVFDYVAPVDITGLTSGLSVIQIGDGVLIGGADQRRDGAVGGR